MKKVILREKDEKQKNCFVKEWFSSIFIILALGHLTKALISTIFFRQSLCYSFYKVLFFSIYDRLPIGTKSLQQTHFYIIYGQSTRQVQIELNCPKDQVKGQFDISRINGR